MRAAVFVVFFLDLLVTARAAPAPDPELASLSRTLDEATTQTDMNITSRDLAACWDRRLASVERRIEAKLEGDELKAFAASKARWSQHRSQDVSFRASFFEGGSMQPLIANAHYAAMTEHRVAELEAFYTDALSQQRAIEPNATEPKNGGPVIADQPLAPQSISSAPSPSRSTSPPPAGAPSMATNTNSKKP